MLTGVFLKMALVGSEWVLWVLLAISCTSIAMIVERITFFWRTYVNGDILSTNLAKFFQTNDYQGAYDFVRADDAIESRVVAAGIETIHLGPEACGEMMLSVKAHEKAAMESRLSVLATIGSNAPFVGLLGTVLGIIKAAHDLGGSASGGANAGAVMAGVFEALVATAVGLLVAIPAVVAYNYFQRRLKFRMGQVDSLSHFVLSQAAAIHRQPRQLSSSRPDGETSPKKSRVLAEGRAT